MASLRFRRAVVAVCACAVPAVASPVLNFEITDFRANLTYNDPELSSSSEPPTEPDGQSLLFEHGNSATDNEMPYPPAQTWGVATMQDPDPPGGEVVTVHFEIWALEATAISAGSPLIISLEALNSDTYSGLAISGSVTIDVALTETFLGDPQPLTEVTDWTWYPSRGPVANEYDLTIDLAADWGAVLFALGSSDNVEGVKVSFEVILPEPPTIALMAASVALCWRRRPR